MIYRIVWKRHITPLGRQIYRQRALAHRTDANGHFTGPMIYDLLQSGWPTPMVPDGGRVLTETQLMSGKRDNGTKVQIGLENAVNLTGWPTPNAGPQNDTDTKWQDRRKKLAEKYGNNGFGMTLGMAVLLVGPVRLTTHGEMLTGCSAGMESGGQLNPEHSRWLMGYPAEWGFCGATAMQSIRMRRRNSSKYSKRRRSMREALKDLLIAAGEHPAREAFRSAYETVRRPVILGGVPADRKARDRLWAATEALKAMNLHTRRWEIGRDVDYNLIREREGR